MFDELFLHPVEWELSVILGSFHFHLLTIPQLLPFHIQNEFLHWMVGNIRGSSVSSGTSIVPYLPPFPMRGFGPLRYIFVLYKQDSLIDFSGWTDASFDDPTTAFATRSFSSYQFLKQHQGALLAQVWGHLRWLELPLILDGQGRMVAGLEQYARYELSIG